MKRFYNLIRINSLKLFKLTTKSLFITVILVINSYIFDLKEFQSLFLHSLIFLLFLDLFLLGLSIDYEVEKLTKIENESKFKRTEEISKLNKEILISLNFIFDNNIPPNLTKDLIHKAYKIKAKKMHPDVGGSNELFQILNNHKEFLDSYF